MIEIVTKELVAGIHAARRIGVSKRRLVQLAIEGKIPAIVDSNGRRSFRAEDVERIAEARRAKARKAAGIE